MVLREKKKAQTGLGLGASIALLGVFVLSAISLWTSTKIVQGQACQALHRALVSQGSRVTCACRGYAIACRGYATARP